MKVKDLEELSHVSSVYGFCYALNDLLSQMEEFGKTVLAVHSLLESSLIGNGLTNREMNGKKVRRDYGRV